MLFYQFYRYPLEAILCTLGDTHTPVVYPSCIPQLGNPSSIATGTCNWFRLPFVAGIYNLVYESIYTWWLLQPHVLTWLISSVICTIHDHYRATCLKPTLPHIPSIYRLSYSYRWLASRVRCVWLRQSHVLISAMYLACTHNWPLYPYTLMPLLAISSKCWYRLSNETSPYNT